MKSRQVGVVLMALIAVGIAGLIARVVVSGAEESVLSGLLPVSQDVITKVTIRSPQSEATLVRIGDVWTLNNQPVFLPKVARFWTAASDIDGARLIATKPANHERMGVAEGLGTEVKFYLGDFLQESFILGKWTPDARLCYLRRAGKAEVYGIECPDPASEVFDADPIGWRNPVVASIPRQNVESVSFAYPDGEFSLKGAGEGEWVVASGEEEKPADPAQVNRVLAVLEVLLAKGFAAEQEARTLPFEAPDASVRVVTKKGSGSPTTRLTFLRRDETSYYVKTPTQATVFIVDKALADELLKRKGDLLAKE